MTYYVFSGTLNPTHFTSLRYLKAERPGLNPWLLSHKFNATRPNVIYSQSLISLSACLLCIVIIVCNVYIVLYCICMCMFFTPVMFPVASVKYSLMPAWCTVLTCWTDVACGWSHFVSRMGRKTLSQYSILPKPPNWYRCHLGCGLGSTQETMY